jgi:UDP-glucuronate 4-epimerase
MSRPNPAAPSGFNPMARYLVTGVAGFIAARVAELLLAQGHTVVGIDNLNDYYDVRVKDHRLARLLGESGRPPGRNPRHSQYNGRGRMAAGGGHFIFEEIDVENLAGLEKLFKEFEFDAVFNLAARAGVAASLDNPHLYLATNTQGALNLLECLRRHGVRKIVLASTSSLYAGCPLPFTEDQPVNTPLSPYAATKKAAELLAYSYHRMHNLDVTVARYFTVFGPAGRPDMSIFRFIQAIANDQPIQLYGDGAQSRDFTFVDDVARGTILGVRPLGYEIINFGGGRAPTNLLEVIALIETALGKKAIVQELPPMAADIKSTRADVTKAARLLGWRPEVAFEDGLAATIAWHQENHGWLNKLN